MPLILVGVGAAAAGVALAAAGGKSNTPAATPTPAPTIPTSFTQTATTGSGTIIVASATPGSGGTISLTPSRNYVSMNFLVTSTVDLNNVYFFAALRKDGTRCLQDSDYGARTFNFRAGLAQSVVINFDHLTGSCGTSFEANSLEAGPATPSTNAYLLQVIFSGGYKFTP
jgi:hypothetical protein